MSAADRATARARAAHRAPSEATPPPLAADAPRRKKRAAKTRRKVRPAPMTIGWREWVGLPQLGITAIKAKVDTGARSSALHAWNITPFRRDDRDWVHFDLHPVQRENRTVVPAEAPVIDIRWVRSSGGHVQQRYVIKTEVELGGRRWPVEITLTGRDEMGFRMLLGRSALRRRCLVNPARSFLGGRAPAVRGP